MSQKLRAKRIGVLMGGSSSERGISLKSGKAVYQALKHLSLAAVAIDIKTEDIKKNIRLIKYHKIDCAFLALHGRFGEDGRIQEILDVLKIPYTGSGALASRLAMDKIASRQIFALAGLKVPRYKVLNKPAYRSGGRFQNSLGWPLVIKPAMSGSSIGLSMINKKSELKKAIESAFAFDERIIIEEHIAGREVTVGILDNQALPVIEIIPNNEFFDYEAKYHAGMTEYVVPAKIKRSIACKIQAVALSAHRLLSCFGSSRADMILSESGQPYILELNTIPGLTATSLLPKAAKCKGIDFNQLCLKLIELAYDRFDFAHGHPERPKGAEG